jgi:hypothetical protein
MSRASFPVLRTAVMVGALLALQGAAAGDREGPRPSTNTFVFIPAAATQPPPTPRLSPAGATVPPAKPVVSNPYQVPLLQNAGSLHAR